MKLSKMNDEQCLEKFLEMLTTRVGISTHFVVDDETGNITHQVMNIMCGKFASASEPQPLAEPLRLANAQETGASLN